MGSNARNAKKWSWSGFIWRSPTPFSAFVAIALLLCFVLGAGPSLQTYALSVINGDTLNIYEALYSTDLIVFPALGDFLLQSLLSPMSVIALFVAAVALRHPEPRAIFWSTAIWCFVAISISDVLVGVLLQEATLEGVFQNIMANAVGSPIAASIVILVLVGCDAIYAEVGDRPFTRQLVAGSFAVSSGFLLLVVGYYASDFLYRPLPVRVDIVLDEPGSGFLAAESEDPRPAKDLNDDESTLPPFSMISGLAGGTAQITSPGNGLLAEWSSLQAPAIFDLSIAIYAGCMEPTAIGAGVEPLNSFTYSDLKTLGIRFEEGGYGITVLPEESSGVKFSLDHTRVSSFWINRLPETKKVEISEHVIGPKLVSRSNESFQFYLTDILAETGKDRVQSRKSVLHLELNGAPLRMVVTPPPLSASDDTIECQALSAADAFAAGELSLPPSSAIHVGIMVSIRERPSDSVYTVDTSMLTMSADSGWVTVSEVSDSDLAEVPAGHAELVSVAGNLSSLAINGIDQSVRPADHYTAFGNFRGSFQNDGHLRFVGTAKALWKDGIRANPTKWESSTWNTLAILLSLVSSLLGVAVTIVLTRIRKNAEFKWLAT